MRAYTRCHHALFILSLVLFMGAALTSKAGPAMGVGVGVGIGGAVELSTAYQPMLNSNGALVVLSGQAEDNLFGSSPADIGAVAGEVRYGGLVLPLTQPDYSHIGNQLNYTYRWDKVPGLTLTVHHSVTNSHGAWVWLRDVEVRDAAPLAGDLTVALQSIPPPLPADTWLPRSDGTGAELGTNAAAVYHLAGATPTGGVALALPMASVKAGRVRLTLCTDPYFSTEFESNRVEWTYPQKGGLENGCEHRVVAVALHAGPVDDSLRHFFEIALPDVKPGPAWLHDIAMVDYDYLSKGGQGWFRDIDALTDKLSKKDRRQVLFCLHGWYDFLGRYCYDPQTGKLDNEWTSFSNWDAARGEHPFGTIGGTKVPMGFENCKPQKMSVAEVHRRLQYARARGYRVALYYADGVNAGDGLPGFEPTRVLRYGGWQGPDSKGKSYFQNPLDPGVREFFTGYTKALLNEYGADIDMLVWDETFHVRAGELGTEAHPGYADRAMMRLAHEVTGIVDEYNRKHRRQIALMASDDLGTFGDVPCALVAHGTYQDSWCDPKAWPYGIFANYRNVLWSCAWWYQSKWPWIEFGVRNYQAPVSLTDGWGDDKGFAELSAEEQGRVIELFNSRKNQPTRLKWFEKLPEN